MAQRSMKDAIRAAGREEFHEHGYHATGIAAITARAAAHKGSFYNHYASKEELAAEVIADYGTDQRMGMLEERSIAPLDRIAAHFAFLAAGLSSFDFTRGCLLGNFSTEVSASTPRIQQAVNAGFGTWADLLAAVLDEAAHPVDDHDSRSTAWLLIDAYEGAALRGRATASDAPMSAFLSTALPHTLYAFRGQLTI